MKTCSSFIQTALIPLLPSSTIVASSLQELMEKVKVQDPALKATDFRALTMLAGASCSGVQGPGSTEQAELASEEAELNLVESRLVRERDTWSEYKRNLRTFHARAHEEKKECNAALAAKIAAKVDRLCDIVCPVRRVQEEGVQTFIADSITSWAEEQGLSREKVSTCFVVRFDALGAHHRDNVYPAIRLLTDHIASDPHTVALIFAPNTGKPGDVYAEHTIKQSVEDISQVLQNEELHLHITQGSLHFNEESLGGKNSTRPGTHTFWLAMSDARDTSSGSRGLNCLFSKSYLSRRGRPCGELEVLDRKAWVNPMSPLTRLGGGNAMSKAQRSKQWLTGQQFWTAIRESLLLWTGLDASNGVAYVDLLPYDDKLQHSVLSTSQGLGSKVPCQMVVAPIWAKMVKMDNVEHVDNARVESFIKGSARRFAATLVREGKLTLEGLDPKPVQGPGSSPPTYDEAMFKITCPNAAGFLPLRQEWIDSISAKIQTKTARLHQLMDAHNKAANPSGVPYKGEKKRPAEVQDSESQSAKEIPDAGAHSPTSRDVFTNEECVEGIHKDHEFFVKEGKLWLHALVDDIISNSTPLIYFWGSFLCASTPADKKEMQRSRAKCFPFALNSMDYMATFSVCRSSTKPGQESKPFNPKPITLGTFVYYLEEQNFTAFTVECHTLKEEKQAVAGVQGSGSAAQGSGSTPKETQTNYVIQPTEECLFLPKGLPQNQKHKMTRFNAGSSLQHDEWDFQKGTHTKGLLQIVMSLEYNEEENSIIPLKPAVFLVDSIKVSKGKWYQLA